MKLPTNNNLEPDARFEKLMRLRFLMRQYKEHLQGIKIYPWEKVEKLCYDIPEEMVIHAKFLAELDVEAISHMKPNFPEDGNVWQRMEKHSNWRGYWMNATGRDLENWIIWIISAMKYPDEHKHRTIIRWFQECLPEVKPIPYSIRLAEEDYNKFFRE